MSRTAEIAPPSGFPSRSCPFHPARRHGYRHPSSERPAAVWPYSSGLVPDPIRVATIAPCRRGRELYEFMRS